MTSAKKAPSEKKIYAELIRNKVMIWDHEEGSRMYSNGFFGKPLGIRKPKGDHFERPVELSLLETLFLLEKERIVVYRKDKKNIVPTKEIVKIGKKYITLIIYEDIRNRGMVPRPGLKFGADFAVYHKGPGIDHSPYVITAIERGSELTAIELVRAGRLATSVRKKYVIATILADDQVRYYGFVWNKP
ncbi:MAG: tRNA-intron lyase [Candidatus Heimdallarchaeota archaeon]